MDLLGRQLAVVQERYPGACLSASPEGHRLLIVPGVPEGAGWNCPAADVLILIPAGYPNVPPDSFYTGGTAPAGLGRRTGQQLRPASSRRDPPVVFLAPVQLGSERWNAGPLRPFLRVPATGSTMINTLDVPEGLWQAIRDDLLSTSPLERAAIGFAGISRQPSGQPPPAAGLDARGRRPIPDTACRPP